MQTRRKGSPYSILDKSCSVDASRLDCLKEVHHTLCLESLQLRVKTDEGSSSTHSITAWVGRKYTIIMGQWQLHMSAIDKCMRWR